MRIHGIQINDYFARKAAELSTPRRTSDASFHRHLAQARHDSGLPSREAQAELHAAWQLGVVKGVVPSSDGYTWLIDDTCLVRLSAGADAQAAEQLAAVLAIVAELLNTGAYSVQLDADKRLGQYLEVYSTTYNAQLAQSLGISPTGVDDANFLLKRTDDEKLTTIWQDAQMLVERHGLRRNVHVLINEQEETSMKKNPTTHVTKSTAHADPSSADTHLTVWRFAQANSSYRLEWLAEMTDGQPTRLICAFGQGSESQRAAIETGVTLLNSALAAHGAAEVVQLALAADGGFFDEETPFADFAGAFAETFLSKQQREQLMTASTTEQQTDLLQTIEGIRCERCQNPVEQFGEYAICMNCGDAQFVR